MQLKLNDKRDQDALRRLIEKSLSGDATSYAGLDGLTFHAGFIKYEADGASCKVTVTVTRKDADPQEVRHWNQYAESFGLPLGMLNKSFTRRNGETVEVIGLCPNRTKFPVMVKGTKGKFLITFEEAFRHKEVANG